jgi:uncharacterized membrane protein YbhN (UPF0104 family)
MLKMGPSTSLDGSSWLRWGVLAVVLVGLVSVTPRDRVGAAANIAMQHVWLLVVILPLAALFVMAKAGALQSAARAAGIVITRGTAARVFAEGTVIETVTWPGKVIGDAYRVALLGSGRLAGRLKTLLLWRAGALGVTACALTCAALAAGQRLLPEASVGSVVMAVFVSMAGAAVLWLAATRMRWLCSEGGGEKQAGRRSGLRIAAWSAAATLSDLAMMGTIATVVSGVDAWQFLPLFVVASAVATASTVPLGVGVLDAGCYAALVLLRAAPDEAMAVVMVYRVCGPGFTLLCGALSMALRPAQMVHTDRMREIQAMMWGICRSERKSVPMMSMVPNQKMPGDTL